MRCRVMHHSENKIKYSRFQKLQTDLMLNYWRVAAGAVAGAEHELMI